MKLENGNSALRGLARVCSKVFMAFQAYQMNMKPPPIYRECIGMDLREYEGFLQNGVELECSRLDLGRHVWMCSDLACTPDQFALVLSID